MPCRSCGAELAPTQVAYERVQPDGRLFRMHVDAYQCSSCDEVVFTGDVADRISAEWYRVVDATPRMPEPEATYSATKAGTDSDGSP